MTHSFPWCRMEHMPEDSPKRKSLVESLVPAVLVVTVGLAFVVGVLWQKVRELEGGGTPKVAGQQANNNNNVAANPEPADGKLTVDQAKKVPAVTGKDHMAGDKNASVYLIEYSDLQCPFCSRFHPTIQKVLEDYKGKVAVVYRHFPLDSIHPKARPAAIAAECVASLSGEDSFWKFIDKVFADQAGTLDKLTDVAKGLGVDEEDFTKCITEKKVETVINDDYEGGSGAGITGTPGSFVVNKKTGDTWLVSGALPFESLKVTLDEALK